MKSSRSWPEPVENTVIATLGDPDQVSRISVEVLRLAFKEESLGLSIMTEISSDTSIKAIEEAAANQSIWKR